MATPNIYGQLPPEIMEGRGDAERLQKIADAMLAQGMAPMGAGRMVGNTFVAPHWLEGVAKLGQVYAGNLGADAARKDRRMVADQYNKLYADEVAKLQQMRSGSAPRPQQMSADDMAMIADQGGESAPMMQDVKPASRQQITDAMLMSRLPQLQQAGMARMGAEYGQELKDQNQVLAPGASIVRDGEIVLTAPNRPVQEKGFKVGDTRQMRVGRSIVTQEYQADGTWKKIAEGDVDRPGNTTVNNAPPVTSVTVKDADSPTGWSHADARSGRITLKGAPPPSSDAENRGRIRDAVNTSDQIKASKDDQRSAVLALRAAGYDPATGKDKISDLIDASTSGALERGAAAVPGFFGISTSGMKALRTVESTANSIVLDLMNRKLGAGISNADREFIVSQLGDVGNAMKPAGERKAAWTAAKNRMIEIGFLPSQSSGAAPTRPPPPAAPTAVDEALKKYGG